MKTEANFTHIGKAHLIGLEPGGRPYLKGVCCQACGAMAFPPQSYGCERCGHPHLEVVVLAADGVVVCSAVVHIHAQEAQKTPFTVAEVRLDGGLIVRALLVDCGGDPCGRRVHGVLREIDAEPGVLEFQFEVEAK